MHGSGSTTSPRYKDYDKLRKRMKEMKHRVCLMEFGLGYIAKVIQEEEVCSCVSVGVNTRKTDDANQATSVCKESKVLRKIATVLQDLDSSFRHSGGDHFEIRAKEGDNANVNQHGEMKAASHAPLGWMETQSGISSVEVATNDNLCNIQPVDNMFLSTQHQNPSFRMIFHNPSTFTHSQYGDNQQRVTSSVDPILSSSLDALSTLATVATTKHAEEIANRAKLQEISQFMLSPTDILPPKKRRQPTMNAYYPEGGTLTRRAAKQRDQAYQK